MSGRGRKLTPGEVNELRALAAAGISDVVIATGMGLNRATIARYTADVVRPRVKAATATAVITGMRPARELTVIPNVDPGWEPACMDAPELEDWRLGKTRGCIDCTVEYSDQMKLINRCNGIPGPLLEGALLREEDTMTEPIIVPAGVEAPIDLEIPCPRCIHKDVCGIRESLMRLDTVPVVLPKLNPAVTIAVSAKVECSFFKRVGSAGRGPAKVRT